MKKLLNCLIFVLALVLCAGVVYAEEEQVAAAASDVHSHCVCGGLQSSDHTCADVEFQPLTADCYETYKYQDQNGADKSTAKSLPSGHYYLTANYSFSGTVNIVAGQKVTLCLNGYKMTTSGRSFAVNGELTICDCQGDGQLYSKYTGNCPTVYTGSGGKYTIYGGTFSAAASNIHEFGGCFGLSNDLIAQDCDLNDDGTVDNTTKKAAYAYIYGGKFIGTNLNSTDGSPSVSGSGACGFVAGSCTLYIYGGEFVGARAVLPQDGGTGGGGIIANTGTTYIYGGKFTGSTDSQGAIWTNNSKLHIAGNPVFENNNNADIFLHYCNDFYVDNAMTNETPIRIAGSSDNFTQIHLSAAEDAAHFVGSHGLTMGKPNANNIMTFTRDRSYCECGGTISAEAKALSGHVCTDKTWAILSQGNMKDRFTTTPTTTGETSKTKYYLKEKEVWIYLSGNVNLNYPIEVSDGYTLHIDLNGYTITHSSATATMFRVFGKLTICDSYGGGKAVGIRKADSEAVCIYALNYNTKASALCTPEIALYSGTLTGFNVTSATNRTVTVSKQGGVVQLGNNSGNKSAVFNMYGGTIRDGHATQGGNVLVGHGSMNMYDGVITGGTATTYGGNIRINSNNVVSLYGGEIANGLCTTVSNYGGNIYMSSGTLTMDHATLSGGCAQHGGNLYVNSGTVNISNSTLTGGKTGYTFTRNADGTVSYSTTDAPGGNGGNIFNAEGTVTLTDCTLDDGYSQGKDRANGIGGHVYNRYKMTMDGCTISDGVAFRGGAIGIRDNSSTGAGYTEITDCTFTGNSASIFGNTVGTWTDKNGCDIIIENCSFDDSANTTGHVIGLDNGGCTNPINFTIKNSTITAGGGNAICCDYGTLNLEGTLDVSDALVGLNLTGTAQIVADKFNPAKPISVVSTINEIGTSATDKGACFTHETLGVNWADGTLYLTGLLQGKNGTYRNIATAIAAGENYVKLVSDHKGDAEITGKLYLDLNGNTFTGDITGTGTLYGMDSATDKYSADNMGHFTGTVSCAMEQNELTRASGLPRRYMAIADDTGYTFHRFWLGITSMHLKPGANGVGYKAAFYGDEMVRNQVVGYGYNLWIGENDNKLSAGKDGTFTSGKEVTARLQNFDVANYGETAINGSVYLTLEGDTTIESSSYTFTLRSMVELIADKADSYDESQLSALRDMLSRFEKAVSGWNINNLLQ